MTVSFDNINKGDTVRIEFAEPLKGWVEGEVEAIMNPLMHLVPPKTSVRLSIDRLSIASITVIEPPIQAGDVVWFEDHWWAIRFTCMADGPLVAIRSDGFASVNRSIDHIPDDAIWLVRGGRLTDRVKVGE